MASRMRTSAINLFDAFYIFQYADGDVIEMVKKYPPDVDDSASLQAIKKFCFPKPKKFWSENDSVVFFTFTLTDNQGLFTFGHCRFSPYHKMCMCIVSALPDLTFFKTLLSYMAVSPENINVTMLEYMYHSPMPVGEQAIKLKNLPFNFTLRDFDQYFSSFNEMEIVLLFNSMNFSAAQIIYLYSSLIRERRIIITATKLDALTFCTYGALKLLYPFHWQGIFIPILPVDLVDQLMAPMPYIIGVPKEALKDIDVSQYGDVAILDVDEQTFESGTNDILPGPISKYLAKQIKQKDNLMTPDVLVRAFMKATIILFGRYRSGLCKADSSSSTKITWDRERFVAAQPVELRSFTQALVCEEGVQYFERFIDEKLEALNNGVGSNEEFDRMIRNVDEYYQDAQEASRSFKDSVQGAVKGVTKNTNAVFGSIKGAVQQTLKKPFTPKISRKKKEVPVPAYSFAPPTLPSPEKPMKTSSIFTNTEPPPKPPSPDIDLMIINHDLNTDRPMTSATRSNASLSPTNCSSTASNVDALSMISASASNPFADLFHNGTDTNRSSTTFSQTNPFLVDNSVTLGHSNNTSTPSLRDAWEKFD
uniref:UDENN domain-containing protein n=1 Tax=Panagrellus redivivus TaxID=6233 RepID=A0A7E4VXS1_PANRE